MSRDIITSRVDTLSPDPAVRNGLAEELGAIVGKLRDGTAADRQKYAARGGHIIWRILMPGTRDHVYYRVNVSAGEGEVLLVWNATAGRNPTSRSAPCARTLTVTKQRGLQWMLVTGVALH